MVGALPDLAEVLQQYGFQALSTGRRRRGFGFSARIHR
jgi:hypothetical protein